MDQKLYEQRLKHLKVCSLLITEKFPGFCSILLYGPRVLTNGNYTAKTDGKIIKVGDKFYTLTKEKQIAKLLEVALHLGLRHHQRASDLAGNPNAQKIWEISTDVIINEILKDYEDLRRQQIDITQDEDRIFGHQLIELGLNFDPKKISAEKLFNIICQSIDKQEISMDSLPDVDESLSGQEFDESSDVLKANGLGDEDKNTNSKLNDALWNSRLRQMAAGTDKNSGLAGLLEHLYEPKTNWIAVLRRFMTERLSDKKETDYSRPSRRYQAGVQPYFTPNRKKQLAIKKMVILLDTSGSCWNSEILSNFVSNIDLIQKSTSSELVIITFDGGVQDEFNVPLDQKLSDMIENCTVEVHGGGGTAFLPPLEKAVEHNPTVVCMFTDGFSCDGFGSPSEFPYPMLWAILTDDARDCGVDPGWGTTVIIEEG